MQYDKFSWDDFCEASKKREIVFFGAADTGRDFYIKYRDQFNIVAAYDNGSDKWNTKLIDVQIKKPETMWQLDAEKVVCVITSQYWYEIISQIKEYGVKYYFVYPVIEKNRALEYTVTNIPDKPEFEYVWDFPSNHYAHALGSIDGVRYTNSKEAFSKSLDDGFKIFEMDVCLLNNEVIGCNSGYCFKHIQYSDGRQVTDNNYNSYNEDGWPYKFSRLQEEKIYGRYEPIKMNELCEMMLKYPEMYLFLDLKYRSVEERTELIMGIKNVLDKFPTEIMNRVIFQTYAVSMYEDAKRIGGFKHYVFHFLNKPVKWMLQMSYLCKMGTIIVNYKEIDDYFINFFHERGYKIGIYGAYRKEELERLQKIGVDIFCLESSMKMREV